MAHGVGTGVGESKARAGDTKGIGLVQVVDFYREINEVAEPQESRLDLTFLRA